MEIAALKHRLNEWARWTADWTPGLGHPSQVAVVELMTPTLVHDGEGADERIDNWAMQVMDAGIESLPPILSQSLYARYFRQIEEGWADQAEARLVPIVQRKGLLLI